MISIRVTDLRERVVARVRCCLLVFKYLKRQYLSLYYTICNSKETYSRGDGYMAKCIEQVEPS